MIGIEFVGGELDGVRVGIPDHLPPPTLVTPPRWSCTAHASVQAFAAAHPDEPLQIYQRREDPILVDGHVVWPYDLDNEFDQL